MKSRASEDRNGWIHFAHQLKAIDKFSHDLKNQPGVACGSLVGILEFA